MLVVSRSAQLQHAVELVALAAAATAGSRAHRALLVVSRRAQLQHASMRQTSRRVQRAVQ